MTEVELADKIYGELLKLGTDRDTHVYVASDGRSGMAHAFPTSNRVQNGPVAVDIHPSWQGYRADMVRTLFVDKHASEQSDMYNCLQNRVKEAIRAAQAGLTLSNLRAVFHKACPLRERWFVLTGALMHGVGVTEFEVPDFAHPFARAGYPRELEPTTVFALSNQGLCSKEGWGVRFEDTVLLTSDGRQILTREIS